MTRAGYKFYLRASVNFDASVVGDAGTHIPTGAIQGRCIRPECWKSRAAPIIPYAGPAL